MNDALRWIESSWLGVTTRDVVWMFPTFEILHFMGLCVLIGTVLVMDLRLLGVLRSIPMRQALSFTPIALGAFAVNLLSGIGFFCSDPFRYAPNAAFNWKMALVLLAGLNALWFLLTRHRRLAELPDGGDADLTSRIIAALSLIIWFTVIVLGRFMPYVEQ
jgi:hypothetical protein